MHKIQKSSAKLLEQDVDKNQKDIARNLESEYGLFINLASPSEERFFLKHRFRSPTAFSKSIPRKNKSVFRCRMNRSLNFDFTNSKRDNSCHLSPNSSLESNTKRSPRDLSRSAQIMRALSFNRNSFHRDENIKKSLNFDSSPSSNGSNSFEETINSNALINTPSPITDKFSRFNTSSNDSSIDMLITSSESIDENHQTPQRSRKSAKISSFKKNANKLISPGSTSLLRSSLKEKIDDIVQASYLQSVQVDRSRTLNCDKISNTFRNLFREFSREEESRPCTPENTIRLIPESPIEKNDEYEERTCRRKRQSPTQSTDHPVTVKDARAKTTIEKLGMTNMSTSHSCDLASIVQSIRKKEKSIKKMLVYNLDDKVPAVTFGNTINWENTSRDFNWIDREEKTRDSVSPALSSHHAKEDCSNKDIARNEERCRPRLQEGASSARDIDVTERENEELSLAAQGDSARESQNSNRAVTPENHINIIQHILTESIKKSHKKVKQENKKELFKPKSLSRDMKAAEPEMLAQDTLSQDSRCENVKHVLTDAICVSTPRNSDRPTTPETVNSSRLLMSQFSSIKKSHKKDKRDHKRRVLEFGKRPDGCCEKNISPLQQIDGCGEEGCKTLRENESPRLKQSSPDVSPNKRKRVTNIQSSPRRLSPSLSPGCEKRDDDFKIYTPIGRKIFKSVSVTNCVHADETSPCRRDEAVQVAAKESKEIDYSRCSTPVSRCAYLSDIKQRRSKSLLTRRKCINDEKLETSVTSDNVAATPDKSGRSTPINMSTTELLCNIDSIKKSHKKDKNSHSVRRRRLSENECNNRTGSVCFAGSRKNLERTIPSLELNSQFDRDHVDETERCSDEKRNEDNNKGNRMIRDDSQPSTSRKHDDIESERTENERLEPVSTPPNSWNTINFIKLLRTTSIKKSHKKERDRNAQAKYILMNKEHDLSDDGSIFDEEDRLISTDSPC